MPTDEGNLTFDFDKALCYRKFDGSDHGLSHCMKSVDYIVETKKQLLFVEVKDPQHPKARPENRIEFVKSLQSEELISEHLVPKYRDSFIYEYGYDRVHKPIVFVVLIAIDTLTDADLQSQTDCLVRQLPVAGPPGKPWPQGFVRGCLVMNIETWNRNFPQFPVVRR